MGVTWMEFDVRVVEGTLVLCHDRSLKRCTGVDALVEEQTLAFVRSLDAGKGERIPLLDEALDLLENRSGAIIELKGQGCVQPVVSAMKRRAGTWWTKDRLMYTSFDHRQLAELHDCMPEGRCLPIFRGNPLDPVPTIRTLGADAVTLDIEFVTKERVAELHSSGQRVYVYTVNSPQDLTLIRACGVDAVFSDFPDRILAALGKA
jgi:glycerophosphoryl diester phosphodiesterase